MRDYSTVKLHTNEESALRAISKHNYKSHVILSKNLIQTNHYNDVIWLNKPIAIGVSILELVSWNTAQSIKQQLKFLIKANITKKSLFM